MISDYFQGRARDRWLAAQTGSAPIIAVVVVLLGGTLGGLGWRIPFYVYSFAFMLIPCVFAFLWEPSRATPINPMEKHTPATFRWSRPLWICIVVTFGMMMFMVTVVQFSFLVTERGMILPRTIGLWSAVVIAANPVGSLIFGVTTARTATKLATAFGLFAVGFLSMSLFSTVPAAIVGASNLGAGFFMPTAITWLLSAVPSPLVGRASGLWTTAVFLGQFLGPLSFLPLTIAAGSLSQAILACALCCAVAAGVAAVCSRLSA